MSEYIITDEWIREYERSVEDLIGFNLEYDSATNPVPPIPARNIIVRCRDCKHFTPKGTHKFENGKVNADYCEYVRGWMLQITPDGFCAWAERREVDA